MHLDKSPEFGEFDFAQSSKHLISYQAKVTNDIPEPWEFLPSPPAQKTPFEVFPSVRVALPAIVWGALFCFVSVAGWMGLVPDLAASGKMVFASGQYWRLFTALFAHGDFGHLGSNLLPFLFFGWILHAYFGRWLFPVASVMIGIVSNLLTIFFYPSAVGLIGASGMIYGMIGLWLVLYVYFAQEKRLAVKVMRALGFAMLMLFPSQYQPNISYLAHATGFATGVATGIVAAPFVRPSFP